METPERSWAPRGMEAGAALHPVSIAGEDTSVWWDIGLCDYPLPPVTFGSSTY